LRVMAPSPTRRSSDLGLVALGGVRVATGKDFDSETGQIPKGRKVVLLDEARARELADRLCGRDWRVTDLSERDQNRSPAPPFTTDRKSTRLNSSHVKI